MTRPTREAYLRGAEKLRDVECHLGLEWRPGDNASIIGLALKFIAGTALLRSSLSEPDAHRRIVEHVESDILDRWPDRAYFVETEEAGVGVQVYQPFGMPRFK